MNQEKEEEMVISKPYKKLIIGAFGVSIAVMLGSIGYVLFGISKYNKKYQHAIENLDSKAISPNENPFKTVDNHRRSWISYNDMDNDGDYESILNQRNVFDKDTVRIQLQKDLEGKINYVNLSENAVNPLEIYNNPLRLNIDYVDIDNDGMLESITYLDNDKTKLMNVESIDGKYVLSEVKN